MKARIAAVAVIDVRLSASESAQDFCGKPLLAWSIEQAAAVRGINRVFVICNQRRIADLTLRQLLASQRILRSNRWPTGKQGCW